LKDKKTKNWDMMSISQHGRVSRVY
jgi:hypothetical protein